MQYRVLATRGQLRATRHSLRLQYRFFCQEVAPEGYAAILRLQFRLFAIRWKHAAAHRSFLPAMPLLSQQEAAESQAAPPLPCRAGRLCACAEVDRWARFPVLTLWLTNK